MKYVFAIISIFFILDYSIAQQAQNSNWHFGDGVGMNIEGLNLNISTTPLNVINGVTPASISDENGVFQCSSNGSVALNAAGDVIDNGEFNNTALENIFLPFPDDSDKYYLFRSGNFGVDYSIIDMTLNGGAGGIAEDEKEIVFHDKLSQLMITQHDNLEDYWLITADNNAGNGDEIFVRSWLIDGMAIAEEQLLTVNYIFAGWFAELDDARISPTCDKIAMMHKGHYLSLYNFDSATGIVYNQLPSAINTLTNFTLRCNLEFSPNGDFVYVIGDFNKIDRFDLTTWTPAAITASKVTVAQIPQSTQTWRDIKLSPYGELYLYNSVSSEIDRVINPNAEGPEFGVESTGASVVTDSYYFPNTPYLVCGAILSQPSISSNTVCIGDTTWLSYFYPAGVEEIVWNFNDDNAIFETNNQNPNWVIFSEVGTYEVTADLFYDGEWHSYSHSVVVPEIPIVDLGPDQQICEGELASIGVADMGYAYQWSSGPTTSMINVGVAGDYELTVNNLGCIRKDTVQITVIPQIAVSLPDVAICGEDSTVTLDAANAATEVYLWNTGDETPAIEVATTGEYTVTMSNVCFTVMETAIVEFVVFPEVILPEDITACQNETVTITSNYTSGILSWNNGDFGPQIEVDEPGMYTLNINHLGCLAQDEIIVDFIPEVSVQLQDLVFCDDEVAVLNAEHPFATDYLWSTGENTPEITINTTGTYWVEVSNSCFSVRDTSFVQYIQFPSSLLPADIGACQGDTIALSPSYTQGNITWSNGSSGNEIYVVESGVYTVFINHLGCETQDEISVQFLEFVSLDDLEIPNVFTPNGDASNQVFRPFYSDDPQLVLCELSTFKSDLVIYNRWGKELVEGECLWDGTGPNGQTMHDGTYYYLINLESSCYQRNETKQIAGHVSLLR